MATFRTITAQYPGRCRRCREAIEPGQKIRYGGRGMTYHLASACPGADQDAAERAAEYRMTPEYQMEVQGYTSAP